MDPRRRSAAAGVPYHAEPARQAQPAAKHVIVGVHGYCVAGGTELATACDLVYVADDARIGYPVVRSISPPDNQFYPWIVGLRRAMELMLTGDHMSGEEAVGRMTAKTLYIVRHGQTEWNVARRMQGHRDSPLTALGETQADLHGRTLAREGGVERLYSSPLGRTRATADLLNAHLSVAVQHEAVLMERDCGLWSGLTLDEIERDYPDEWQARMADPYHHRPPEGENLVDMETRVGAFVDNLLERPEGVVALVTHGVMSRVLIKRLLALDTEEAATVRHPNELFYRVDVDVPGAASSAYFLQGQGPTPGLLRQHESETVPRR